MTDLRLLPASLLPPDPLARAESASPTATRIQSQQNQRNPAGSVDRYVWSVSPCSDGSFLFYAVPLGSRSGSASSQRQYSASASPSQYSARATSSSSVWEPGSIDVAARYAFYASLSGSAAGRRLDVYA